MFTVEESHKIRVELENGENAQQQGFEGRARVCFRRAAGIALSAFLKAKKVQVPKNVISVLETTRTIPDLPPSIYPLIEHLLIRVDGDYHLPKGIDLASDTHHLIDLLQDEWVER
jgi:hypothetical protein